MKESPKRYALHAEKEICLGRETLNIIAGASIDLNAIIRSIAVTIERR
jgi:hypothetical protein